MVQLDWQLRQRPFSIQENGRSTVNLNGWYLISGFTVLFLSWMTYRVAVRPEWIMSLAPAVREMFTITEVASGFTLMLVWTAVWWQQNHIPANSLLKFTNSELHNLSPAQFEQYIGHLFRYKGYLVQVRAGVGDLGVDLELIHPNGRRAVVQCKRYQRTISPDVVRDLYGTMIHERVSHAFLVTTGDISAASRQWAKGKPITLIDGTTLDKIIHEMDSHS